MTSMDRDSEYAILIPLTKRAMKQEEKADYKGALESLIVVRKAFKEWLAQSGEENPTENMYLRQALTLMNAKIESLQKRLTDLETVTHQIAELQMTDEPSVH